MPAGALRVLAVARWRSGWVLAPLGLVGARALLGRDRVAAARAARIGRACDVTDVVDNVTGAVLGGLIGLVLVLALRPWRRRTLAT